MARTERKIAVVLIHGIGDQRPMATLRGFVEALLRPDPDPGAAKPPAAPGKRPEPLYWSKPDALSQSFELRRYQAKGGGRRPGIDFYEYYWANRMEGSAIAHSLQWINNLLLHRPGTVPERLRKLWWLAWGLVAAGAALAVLLWIWTPAAAVLTLIGLLLAAGKLVARLALRDWIGDAARYFDDRPQNVGVRESIRRGGVDLLRKIHESGDYGRVIVVGHSLGSAIAFDILYHYWTTARESHAPVDRPVLDAFEDLQRLIRSRDPHYAEAEAARAARKAEAAADPAAGGVPAPGAAAAAPAPEDPARLLGRVRALQKAVWRELRAVGVPWRVTDLVTLGSPLTHLPFLTGLDADEFEERQRQRELPTCPPVLDEGRLGYWVRYTSEAGETRSVARLHHAGCFAATRWTNLYFEHDGWLGGDPVGGPLYPLFGFAVDDRKVATRHWGGRLNHLDYWRDDEADRGRPCHPLATLREVLAFEERFRPLPPPDPRPPAAKGADAGAGAAGPEAPEK